jgi:hypothetical protein
VYLSECSLPRSGPMLTRLVIGRPFMYHIRTCSPLEANVRVHISGAALSHILFIHL